jgi:hypothetical protein
MKSEVKKKEGKRESKRCRQVAGFYTREDEQRETQRGVCKAGEAFLTGVVVVVVFKLRWSMSFFHFLVTTAAILMFLLPLLA